MRKYLFIIVAAIIKLSFFNHRSIRKAVELCEEGKGIPQVKKDMLAVNWRVSCDK